MRLRGISLKEEHFDSVNEKLGFYLGVANFLGVSGRGEGTITTKQRCSGLLNDLHHVLYSSHNSGGDLPQQVWQKGSGSSTWCGFRGKLPPLHLQFIVDCCLVLRTIGVEIVKTNKL